MQHKFHHSLLLWTNGPSPTEVGVVIVFMDEFRAYRERRRSQFHPR